MESQPDIVVAAEALRGWIREQRTTWTATAIEPFTVPVLPLSLSAPLPAPVAEQQVLVPALVLDRSAVSEPEGVPVVAPPRLGRLVRRAVIGLAIAASLAGVVVAGRAARNRFNTAPRIGTASFTSEPSGARVLVDGTAVGITPVKVELLPGSHAVEFRLNAATRTQTITVLKGRQTSFAVTWNPRRIGGVRVTSTPDGAKVLMDGRERGVTPLTLDDVAVGSHTVQIDSSAGSVRRRIGVVEGKTEVLAESIYPGWVHVSMPIDVILIDGATAVQLDDSNRALLKPGTHSLRIENRALAFSVARQVEIEPGGTAEVTVDVPLSALTVTSVSDADVYVDGVKAGETPLTEFPVKLGRRDVMVVDQSGATRHATVTVTTKPAELDISFSRP